MPKNYALLDENNIVVNIAVFADNADKSNYEAIAQANNAVAWKSIDEYGTTAIGGTFYNNKLWLPQPYPSWIRGEEKWEAPIPYPEIDIENVKYYLWNENAVNWVEISK